jgi:hypothetical protein
LTQKPGLLAQARRKAGHGICVKFRRGFCVQKPLARMGVEKSAISHWFGRKAARGLQVRGS